MITASDLNDAGFCMMGFHLKALAESSIDSVPLATHEVIVPGVSPFLCCSKCAKVYGSHNGVSIRDTRMLMA